MRDLRLPLAAFAIGTFLFAAVTPPFAVPDETFHFHKAVQYSELTPFNIRQGETLGNMLPAWVDELETVDFPGFAIGKIPTFRLDQLAAAWRRPYPDERRFSDFSLIANYPPALYLPQAAGLAAARGLGLPPLGRFYAARLFNATAFVLLALFAVRLLPFGRPILVAILALPMVAHQAASCSADATIMGVAFLGLALSLQAARLGLTGERRVAPLAVVPALALAKGVYLPLTLASLAVRQRRSTLVWLGLCLLIAVAVFAAWNGANRDNLVRQPMIDGVTGLHAHSALPQEQLAYVLGHPLGTARVIVSSFVARLPVYVVSMIGRFGWLSVLLPAPLYGLALLIAAAGLLHPEPGGFRPTPRQRAIWVGLAVGMAMLVELALYLTATPLGADYVLGTQGRYFLPILPLAGLAAAIPSRPDSRLGRAIAVGFAPAIVLLVAGGLLTSLLTFWRL